MTSTTAAPAPETPRSRLRWGRLALIVSLALNLLFIGVAAGAVWRFRQGSPHAMSAVNANLLSFTATLPSERRRALWHLTASERQAMRPLRAEVRAARASARDALQADPFDRDRFAKAQAALLDAEVRARAEAHRLFLAVAGALTREERLAFARWQPGEGHERPRGMGRWWKREPSGERAIKGQEPSLAPLAPAANQR